MKNAERQRVKPKTNSPKAMQTDAELRQREQLFTEAQKVARIGVYVLDVASGIWKSSEVLDEIFGIDDETRGMMKGRLKPWRSLLLAGRFCWSKIRPGEK